jgi:hypothetical protein
LGLPIKPEGDALAGCAPADVRFQEMIPVPSDLVLIWRHLFRLAGAEQPPRSALCAHGCPRCVAGVRRLRCLRPGGCHTDDHFACDRSRRQSGRDVDGITERREVIDSCAEPGCPNERHACVDSRSCRDRTRSRDAGVRRSLCKVDRGCYRCCRMLGPVIPLKKSPITSSPTILSMMPS